MKIKYSDDQSALILNIKQNCHAKTFGQAEVTYKRMSRPGPTCSKLMMLLVNVSLKL